ncbi:hypothetical protein [Cellulomonas shaoxiangyii]|uniref:Uncharacterized protein n=1 Tax=Cellulomonas shaoxiangyii TaxID=2566013 RepID=A0A4P7SJA7_9CELL|nr:hypothetical protein [Cellulomonas shaoxiangyii]QCB94349.1 hypothetical protein E5225_13080 [Cellulomonas shaoxiangyii]TGY85188.1 hypothetical protein E5226_07665 [Cellulomonas shaoxiangyii]
MTGAALPPWRAWPPGARVVVRRRRDDLPPAGAAPVGGPDEPPYTDVLGDLLAVDDDGLTVRTRRGDVHVPAADVLLGKLVPPAPVRRRPRAPGAVAEG